MKRTVLESRGVLKLSGSELDSFLQGLISNDIREADGEKAIYAAFLTPQGKFLYDFFVIRQGDDVFLDCRAEDIPAFAKKLKMHKLRSDVSLDDVSEDYRIHALFDGDTSDILPADRGQKELTDGAIVFRDPRLAEAGLRLLAPVNADLSAFPDSTPSEDDYQHHRISLGLPEAPTDLIADKSILLESGFDELNGVNWKKGCYMGQELTARTKYRGLVKKRLVPIHMDGQAGPGDDVMADGKVVGDVRSIIGDSGIAMIRVSALEEGAVFAAGDAKLTVNMPEWIKLPEPAD